MAITYNPLDNFWDLESFTNLFSGAHYYPESKRLLLYYICDDDSLGMHLHPVKAAIASKIKDFFYNNEVEEIYFWDLADGNNAINLVKLFGAVPDMAMAYDKNVANQAYKDVLTKRPEDLTPFDALLRVTGLVANTDNNPLWFYPIKDTDPEYDPQQHGRFFGYNSINYDETMMALLFYDIANNIKNVIKQPHPDGLSIEDRIRAIDWSKVRLVPTAQTIREQYNDRLFDEFLQNMPDILQEEIVYGYNGPQARRNWNSEKVAIKKAWRWTNRFIDVSRLNEKLAKVALKRIFAYLGLTIKEADTSNNTTIKDQDDLINRFVYNTSDVVRLQNVLEHKAYGVPYDLHSQLLERYPQTIYNHVGDEITPDVRPDNIRKNRLTIESTSAKFVEMIVAPYNALSDDEFVSVMYPSKTTINRIKRETGQTIKQFDVLEDTTKWFHEHVTNDPTTQAYQDWQHIYDFYDSIRGKNFNTGKQYVTEYPDNGVPERTPHKDYIREQMQKHNTSIFYYNKDLTRSSGYASLSIGGIHGAEIHKARYEYDCRKADKHNAVIKELQELAGDGTVKSALTTLKPRVMLADGTEVKVRDYIKNPKVKNITDEMEQELGDSAYGSWKFMERPEMFRLKKKQGSDFYAWELQDKYKYVSTGKANHEDFASYYPLLLSMLSAFENTARGLDENGEPIDVYYQLYQTRLTEKNRSKDKTLSNEIRALANTTQLLMKLLINSASGVGDGKFDTNLRVNNRVIAMRIIGQLFAWRIGQAETLAGATVVSTNTDGLYTTNISPEENDRVLFETVKPMLVDIEPERLINFVSKDSNNRLEIHTNWKTGEPEIAAANGGSLTSWEGPEPVNNLAHPAMSDRILAEYLWKKEDAPNQPFDRAFATELYHNFIKENLTTNEGRFKLTRFLQWVLASSNSSHRYIYQKEITRDANGNTHEQLIQCQHINRAFIVKKEFVQTMARLDDNKDLVDLQTWIAAEDKDVPKGTTADAIQIHKLNGYFASKNGKYSKTVKVPKLENDMTLLIDNETQERKCAYRCYNNYGADFFEHVIDHEKYIDLIENTFTSKNAWYNPSEERGEFEARKATRKKGSVA